MIPKSGCRFPACAKPGQLLVRSFDASAGEGRSEKIMLKQKAKAKGRFNLKPFRLSLCQEHLMCGRAKLPNDVSEIKLDLKIDLDEIGDYRPRWNAAPTSKLPVVISDNARRVLTLMRWGLVPSWADDLKIGYSTFNARAESLATRAAFRGAWQAGRRCLAVADGYYEWRDCDRQPFAIALANRGPMTLAGPARSSNPSPLSPPRPTTYWR